VSSKVFENTLEAGQQPAVARSSGDSVVRNHSQL
jgi:hypothetical protein